MSRARHRPRRICGAPVTTSKGNAATCGGTFEPALEIKAGGISWRSTVTAIPGVVECRQCGRRERAP